MKTIIITGSSSGIGMAVSRTLAEKEVQLVLHYHKGADKAEQLSAEMNTTACEYSLYRADLTNPDNAKALIEHTLNRFGRLDVLINIVGPFVYKSILEVTPDEWRNDIDLNLHACFHTAHFALPSLRRRQGQLINFAFSGVENIKGWPMSAGYCAAKTGVAALTKSLAVALAPDRVRVNAICPGLVEEDEISAEERRMMASQIPYGRPVQPDEIARTVSWLIFDSPESMTGSLITVSGAWEY